MLTNGFDPDLLEEHFYRHRADFRVASPEAYEARADAFMGRPLAPPVLECERGNGDILRYNEVTQEFGIMTAMGIVRTYFKPDPDRHGMISNLEYFESGCTE